MFLGWKEVPKSLVNTTNALVDDLEMFGRRR